MVSGPSGARQRTVGTRARSSSFHLLRPRSLPPLPRCASASPRASSKSRGARPPVRPPPSAFLHWSPRSLKSPESRPVAEFTRLRFLPTRSGLSEATVAAFPLSARSSPVARLLSPLSTLFYISTISLYNRASYLLEEERETCSRNQWQEWILSSQRIGRWFILDCKHASLLPVVTPLDKIQCWRWRCLHNNLLLF